MGDMVALLELGIMYKTAQDFRPYFCMLTDQSTAHPCSDFADTPESDETNLTFLRRPEFPLRALAHLIRADLPASEQSHATTALWTRILSMNSNQDCIWGADSADTLLNIQCIAFCAES
eukprot:6468834-Amphidinium_carterae.1